MIKKLKDILVEAPDFPQFVAESLSVEAIEQLWNFYSAGVTSDSVRRLMEMNSPEEFKKRDIYE